MKCRQQQTPCLLNLQPMQPYRALRIFFWRLACIVVPLLLTSVSSYSSGLTSSASSSEQFPFDDIYWGVSNDCYVKGSNSGIGLLGNDDDKSIRIRYQIKDPKIAILNDSGYVELTGDLELEISYDNGDDLVYRYLTKTDETKVLGWVCGDRSDSVKATFVKVRITADRKRLQQYNINQITIVQAQETYDTVDTSCFSGDLKQLLIPSDLKLNPPAPKGCESRGKLPNRWELCTADTNCFGIALDGWDNGTLVFNERGFKISQEQTIVTNQVQVQRCAINVKPNDAKANISYIIKIPKHPKALLSMPVLIQYKQKELDLACLGAQGENVNISLNLNPLDHQKLRANIDTDTYKSITASSPCEVIPYKNLLKVTSKGAPDTCISGRGLLPASFELALGKGEEAIQLEFNGISNNTLQYTSITSSDAKDIKALFDQIGTEFNVSGGIISATIKQYCEEMGCSQRIYLNRQGLNNTKSQRIMVKMTRRNLTQIQQKSSNDEAWHTLLRLSDIEIAQQNVTRLPLGPLEFGRGGDCPQKGTYNLQKTFFINYGDSKVCRTISKQTLTPATLNNGRVVLNPTQNVLLARSQPAVTQTNHRLYEGNRSYCDFQENEFLCSIFTPTNAVKVQSIPTNECFYLKYDISSNAFLHQSSSCRTFSKTIAFVDVSAKMYVADLDTTIDTVTNYVESLHKQNSSTRIDLVDNGLAASFTASDGDKLDDLKTTISTLEFDHRTSTLIQLFMLSLDRFVLNGYDVSEVEFLFFISGTWAGQLVNISEDAGFSYIINRLKPAAITIEILGNQNQANDICEHLQNVINTDHSPLTCGVAL